MTKCIIVDDERPARELIQLHLSDLKDFSLIASFDNAVEAFSFMQKNGVDLAFLDINMPKLSGLNMVKSLQVAPKLFSLRLTANTLWMHLTLTPSITW